MVFHADRFPIASVPAWAVVRVLPRSGRICDRSGRLGLGAVRRRGVLRCGEFAHGGVEGEAEDLDEEVDGVAGLVSFGPAPIRVLRDEAGEGGHRKVAATGFDELESAFFQKRDERGRPCGADLFAGPRRVFGSEGLVTVFVRLTAQEGHPFDSPFAVLMAAPSPRCRAPSSSGVG